MNIFVLVLLFFILPYCSVCLSHGKTTFLLTGILKGRDTGKLILWYPNTQGQYTKDTTFLKDGHFKFEGAVAEPSFSWLIGSPKDGNKASFFLEAGHQEVILSENQFDQIQFTGSLTQKQNDSLNYELNVINVKYKLWIDEFNDLVNELRASTDSVNKKRIKESILKIRKRNEVIDKEVLQVIISFIQLHPNSYVSATRLYGLLTNRQVETKPVETLYFRLSNKIQQSKGGKLIGEELKKRETNIKTPMFVAEDLAGHTVSLNDFKGKYVLLSFWASWCLPCIEELPELKKVAKRYKHKGLEIVTVSIDKRKELWQTAAKKNKMEGFCNILANRSFYDNYANATLPIPSQLLINREGMVIWNSVNDSLKRLEDVLETNIPNKLTIE